MVPILDFKITLRSIPPWMSIYSPAKAGCVHRIVATLKVKDSQSNYDNFTLALRSVIGYFKDAMEPFGVSIFFFLRLVLLIDSKFLQERESTQSLE